MILSRANEVCLGLHFTVFFTFKFLVFCCGNSVYFSPISLCSNSIRVHFVVFLCIYIKATKFQKFKFCMELSCFYQQVAFSRVEMFISLCKYVQILCDLLGSNLSWGTNKQTSAKLSLLYHSS